MESKCMWITHCIICQCVIHSICSNYRSWMLLYIVTIIQWVILINSIVINGCKLQIKKSYHQLYHVKYFQWVKLWWTYHTLHHLLNVHLPSIYIYFQKLCMHLLVFRPFTFIYFEVSDWELVLKSNNHHLFAPLALRSFATAVTVVTGNGSEIGSRDLMCCLTEVDENTKNS